MNPLLKAMTLAVTNLTLFAAQPLSAQTPSPQALSPAAIRVQLVPRHSTVLSSELTGKITELGIREGEAFSKGQRLVALDCRLHQARLAKADAQLLEAVKTNEVYKDLAPLGSISTLDLETSEARVQAARAETDIMKALVERCGVAAPFAGRVAELKVRRHQYVAEGQELMEILSDKDLEIEMIVPSPWLSWLAPGKRFKVHIEETQRAYVAEVTRLGARIDPVSQSVKVFGRLVDAAAELRVGMSGTAGLEIP